MATIAVAAVGAVVTKGLTGLNLALVTSAVAAASIGAAYIDQRYIYPALFGKDRPQTPNITGIDEMTGDDGAPGHTSWGRMALCGGHVLFFENYEIQDVGGGGSKKGTGVPAFKRRIADVGIGWTRNLITSCEQILADQKVFWRREPNNVIWSDYRVEVSVFTWPSGGPTVIRYVPNTGDVQNPGQLFVIGDVVKVENSPTAALNGYWRVHWVLSAGAGGGAPFGAFDLVPLEGQTPTAGSPGTSVSPMRVRRIDASIIDYTQFFRQLPVSGSDWLSCTVQRYPVAPGGSSLLPQQDSHYWRRPSLIFTQGTIVRFENFANDVNGLWEVVRVSPSNYFGPLGDTWDDEINFRRVQSIGTVAVPVHTSPTNVGRIVIALDEGFLEPDPQQTLQHYLGTEDQGPDVDLLGVYGTGNVHGYRGLARTTIRKLNLTNFGDRVPQFSAAVKVSDSHTTHDVIRDLMREAFEGDDSRYDLSKLESNALLGYTRRGRQETTTTLQPLAIAYGIESQERGDRWTFFKGKDADVVQLAEDDFGVYVGRENRPGGPFAHQRTQDADLPRSLSVYYRDPLNDFSRTQKNVSTSLPEDGQVEEVAVDLDPLVLYPWDAQNVVNRLFDESLTARDQGKIVVPPSRCDMLPNDRVTFTALNSNQENATIVSGEITHTLAIGGIEPFSVSIELDLESNGRFRIVDDGAGALIGWPEEVTVVDATIDYATGEVVAALGDDAIVSARITYEFPSPWRMRIQRVTRRVNRTTELDLVAVADKFPLVGSPVQFNEPAIAPVVRAAQLRWHVLDIPASQIHPDQSAEPGLFAVAAALPGSEWRGAVLYSSEDGIAYEPRGSIATQSTVGVTTDVLGAGDRYVPDWENSVNVVLDHGELESVGLAELGSFTGRNLALIGDEVVAFQSATLEEDGSYTLTGLLRGRRDTEAAMATHVAGERFVLLDGISFPDMPTNHGLFQPLAASTDIGQSRWWRVVPAGGVLDAVEPVQLAVTGANVRPFRPSNVIQGSIADYAYDPDGRKSYDPTAWLARDIVVRWWRRGRQVVGTFAVDPMPEPVERYEVRIYRNGNELLNRRTIVGAAGTGSPMVHRTFRYTLAEQVADGWTSGDEAAIEVRQFGMANTESLPAGITWTLP